jgi:hypothetical protein
MTARPIRVARAPNRSEFVWDPGHGVLCARSSRGLAPNRLERGELDERGDLVFARDKIDGCPAKPPSHRVFGG